MIQFLISILIFILINSNFIFFDQFQSVFAQQCLTAFICITFGLLVLLINSFTYVMTEMIILFCVLLAVLVSAFSGDHPFHSIVGCIYYIGFVSLFFIFKNTNKIFAYTNTIAFVTILSFMFLCLMQIIYVVSLDDKLNYLIFREVPFFKNIRHWNYLVEIVISMFVILTYDRKNVNYLLFVFMVFCYLGLGLSGARGAIYSTIISAFILLLIMKNYRFFAAFILSSGLGLFMAFLISKNNIDANGGMDLLITRNNNFSSSRVSIWRDYIQSLISDFRFFGNGPDDFSLTSSMYNISSNHFNEICYHPHNVLLQYFGDLGIPGIIFLLVIPLFYVLKKRKEINYNRYGMIFLIVTIGLHSIVDGLLYYNLPRFYFVIALACLFPSPDKLVLCQKKWSKSLLVLIILFSLVIILLGVKQDKIINSPKNPTVGEICFITKLPLTSAGLDIFLPIWYRQNLQQEDFNMILMSSKEQAYIYRRLKKKYGEIDYGNQ